MLSAQMALRTAAVVVLHEIHVRTVGFIKSFLIGSFAKGAARVAEHFGFDDEKVGNGGGGDFQTGALSSFNSRNKY